MPRYVTPAGVVVEMSDKAARTVGYQPEKAEPKPEPVKRKPAGKKSK